MIDSNTINWLLDGDVAIQYQVYRDLLDSDRPDLQKRISEEGWGARLLSLRQENGHWGLRFYMPKWTSTHYTLLDLKNLGISPDTKAIRETIRMIIERERGEDGGINPAGTIKQSDVCINGMFLNYASYFNTSQADLRPIIDFILSQQLPDGGFNCRFNRQGATHSSLHSTLSVIEGIAEYSKGGYRYKLNELLEISKESGEFILAHRLYKSHRTGEIIDKKMMMLSYPSRWRYDLLRALDYFRVAEVAFDSRMTDAVDVLLKKQRPDKKWPLQLKHSGKVHFDMEHPKEPSRWNTLRALRVLKHFDMIDKTNE